MIKPFRTTIALTVVLSIALLGAPQRALAQTQISNSFTGEQIFRGLLFGEAPVSQLFPEIWATDQATVPFDSKEKVIAFNELKEQLVAELISTDPTFMSRFEQEMQSGDQVRVQASLEEASQKALSAMQTLGYIDLNGNPIGNFTGDRLWAYGFVAAAAVLVVVLAGAAVVAGAWVIYWYRFYPNSIGEPSEQESLLYRETLVNSMTEKLSQN